MTSALTSWRLGVRIARRDALRHRGRSLLMLAMIMLPVLAVTTADVMLKTADVSPTESLDRRMGTAAALIVQQVGAGAIVQDADPDQGSGWTGGAVEGYELDERGLSDALGGARLLPLLDREDRVTTDKGAVLAELTEVDLTDPLTTGLFALEDGSWPDSTDEVVINQALADRGYEIGATLDLVDQEAPSPQIVGIAESASSRTFPQVAGPIGSLGLTDERYRSWLVETDKVSWPEILTLNAQGAQVLSRYVVENPPPLSQIPPEIRQEAGIDEATIAVIVLIAVMALIEVVLLAGPAFAVNARNQQRSLALMTASGATPAQGRRVIVGTAIVMGGLAGALGLLGGVLLARVLMPLAQSRSSEYFGPFEIVPAHLLAVVAFGMVSAVLASAVPAYIASRQDVVAVLAGRRGDRAPTLRSPALGLVLLIVGIAGSYAGSQRLLISTMPEVLIAFSAIPTVLGMVLLISPVLAGLGRVAKRLPLTLRYAVRDAARHRSRTVPAVAAVAATVAGVVALGIGVTSDEAENREGYAPSLADGFGLVTAYGAQGGWDAMAAAVGGALPNATVIEQRGVIEHDSYTYVSSADGDEFSGSYGSSAGASVMVSDTGLPPGILGVDDTDAATAARVLAAGGAIVTATPGWTGGPQIQVKVKTENYDPASGELTDRSVSRLDATVIPVPAEWVGPQAVLSESAAKKAGLSVEVVALAVVGDISRAQEAAMDEVLAGIDPDASMYVERGYQADDETRIAQLILLALGAVLMLGGTLTATFLALSDARPDLATLSAVGAEPRTRRGVAAAYATVIGLVGAVLGAAVGFVPGVAVTYPLTGGYASYGAGATPSHVLDVPWLMIATIVVLLPLATAAFVALVARSRLPLVARLS